MAVRSRSPGRSSPARQPTCSPRPTNNRWTRRSKAARSAGQPFRPPRQQARRHRAGAIADRQRSPFTPEAFQAAIGCGTHWRRARSTPCRSANMRKEALQQTRPLERGRAASGDDRQRARGARLRVPRRGALGIVYSTDAASDPSVKIVATFPETSHPADPLSIRADRLDAGQDRRGKFLTFLKSPGGRGYFRASGLQGLE